MTSDDQTTLERFRVEPEVFDRFPGYVAVVVVARGVHNGPSASQVQADLRSAAQARASEFNGGPVSEHPQIACWRRAYSAFGSKPSRYRSSIESLVRRVAKGDVPSISTLVDIYNTVSLAHLLPIGGEDLEKLDGPLVLTGAAGDETFEANWESASDDPIRPGEMVWVDRQGVTCRRWNWRQSSRTAIDVTTTSAYFVIDCLPPSDLQSGLRAARDLTSRLSLAFDNAAFEAVTVASSGATAVDLVKV